MSTKSIVINQIRCSAICQAFEMSSRLNQSDEVPNQTHKADSQPMLPALYKESQKARAFRKKHISQLLPVNAIHPVQAKWISSIVSIQKQDSTFCFCDN